MTSHSPRGMLCRWKPRDCAARAAVAARVESGTVVGLGSGQAASLAASRVWELLSLGSPRNARGIPTSQTTARLAIRAGFPRIWTLSSLEARIERIPGAPERGPFVGPARTAFAAHEDATVVMEAWAP